MLMQPLQTVLILLCQLPTLHFCLSYSVSLSSSLCFSFFPTPPAPLFSHNRSQLEKNNSGKVMVHDFCWKLYVIQSRKNSKRTIRIFASCHCFKCAKLWKLRFQTVWKSEQLKSTGSQSLVETGGFDGLTYHGGISAVIQKNKQTPPPIVNLTPHC